MSNYKNMTMQEVAASLQNFTLLDYVIFLGMLIGCSLIGIYFALTGKKENSKGRRNSAELDYLVGGRKMKVFPVAISLIASWISGITLLGSSTEMYFYGTEFCMIFVAILITALLMHFVFLPVFAEMQITSIYEYLEARYDRKMRTFGSVLFFVGTFVWIPIVVFVPALSFNQVTGVNIHIITPIVCLICIFYTSIGGIKAVVWTDVIQTIIMMGTVLFVVVKGTLSVGGVGVVIQRNYEGDRLELPSWSLDPMMRHSMWSIVIGGSMFWTMGNSTTQTMMQRYLSVPTLRGARQTLWVFIIGVSALLCMCFYNGLLIYAVYHDCDPITTGLAKAKDQMVPLVVMDIFQDLPGLPGLFVAGIFSAALSSLSSALNSLSAIALEDFIKPRMELTERQTNLVMRLFVLLCGGLCIALVFVVEHLGTVMQLSMSFGGTINGPLFAIFVMGLTMPWINTKTALTGGIIGILLMGGIEIKRQSLIALGEIVHSTKPMSTEGCLYEFSPPNVTISNPPTHAMSQTFFHFSYIYTVVIGFIITAAIAHLAMLIFGAQNPAEIDIKLLTPFARTFVKKSRKAKEVVMLETNDFASYKYDPVILKTVAFDKDEERKSLAVY